MADEADDYEFEYVYHAVAVEITNGKWIAHVFFERWPDHTQPKGYGIARRTLDGTFSSQREAHAAGERFGKERVESGNIDQ